MNTQEIQNIYLTVIMIPRMEQSGNESTYSLLKKSGYFEMYDQVTVEGIRQTLIEHPDCIDEWLEYSECQRSHPTWFFQSDGTDYEVGFVSINTEEVPVTRTRYQDRFEACATFIKNTLELVRQIP